MTIFRFSLLAMIVTAGAVKADGAAATLPSGQVATLYETIWEPQTAPVELWLRLRFVVPGLTAGQDFDLTGADLLALCREVARPVAAKAGRTADQAILSLASEPLPFGEVNPAVVQYFEAFRLTDTDCILEGF